MSEGTLGNLLDELLKLDLMNAMTKPKTKKKPKKKKGPQVLPKEIGSKEHLYRFLLTGSKDGLYFAGILHPKKSYNENETAFIKDMVQDEEKTKEFVEIIRFVKSNPIRSVEPCFFALAVAIKSAVNPSVKNILYTEAINIVDDCEDFFSLLDHMGQQKVGTPSGWRRFVSSWYKSIPPSKLAAMVSSVKSRHGWSHKDVITLSHGLKPAESDVGLKVVTLYVFKGLSSVTSEFGENPLAKEIINILKTHEQARQCEDSNMLATLIDDNQHIGQQMVLQESKIAQKNTSGVVWKALLKKMPIDEVLRSIQTMHNHLALIDFTHIEAKGDTDMAPLLQLLKKEEFNQLDVSDSLISLLDKTSRTSPVLAYMTLRDYEEGRKRIPSARLPFYTKTKKDKQTFTASANSSESSKNRWAKLSRKGELVPPSRPVIEALQSLVERSLLDKPRDQKLTGKYMVTVDARSHMFKVYQSIRKAQLAKKNAESEKTSDKTEANSNNATAVIPPVKVYDDGKNHCFWAEHVSPGKAAVLLALYFVSHIQEVTVAVFTDQGVEEVFLTKENGQLLTMKEAEEKLTSSNLGLVSLCSPIEWAMEKKNKYDLFVNILRTSSVTCKIPKERRMAASNPHTVLYDYQKTMDVPHAGLVNISLGKFSRVRTDYNQRRVLDIVGLDEHITDLIHAFANEKKYREKI